MQKHLFRVQMISKMISYDSSAGSESYLIMSYESCFLSLLTHCVCFTFLGFTLNSDKLKSSILLTDLFTSENMNNFAGNLAVTRHLDPADMEQWCAAFKVKAFQDFVKVEKTLKFFKTFSFSKS